MNRAILRGSWCRPQVIRSLSFPSTSKSRRTLSAHSICNANDRSFSSKSRFHSEQSPVTPPNSASGSDEGSKTLSGNEKLTSSSHVPWYLQESPPISESQQMSSRDQIPDLPENPPEILPVLLDYVFKDLGLDNLKLIDLRPLESPPPLGANVIMIIGTARSVKHLNVSADRLCRWLRSTWKLSPYADGLLGRNELKIKLRRKARRARIASQTGAMVDDKDDGITTGWICVNAGVVEKGPVPQQEMQNFEGFGHITGDTRVVVQMFTEEKRAEVDLEVLWQKTLDRDKREKQKRAEVTSTAPLEEVRASISVHPSTSDHHYGHCPRSPASLPVEQRRRFHSSLTLRILPTGQGLGSTPNPSSNLDSAFTQTHPNSFFSVSTDSLLRHLSGLPDEDFRYELGQGPGDASTLFLRQFLEQLTGVSAEEKAISNIKLLCVAISRQHPAYSKEGLLEAFDYCTAMGYSISDELGFQVVSTLLTERPTGLLPDKDKETALDILEYLSFQGTDVLNMKVFNMIYKVTTRVSDVTSPEDAQERLASNKAAGLRILRMIDMLQVPFDPEQARILMVRLFQNQDYEGFWKLWRKLPLNDSPRTVADYELLFRLHIDLGDQSRAHQCLSTWFPMMSREDPPIPLQGQLLQDIRYCIILADPEIEDKVADGSTCHLARIWRECERTRAA
ncbi:ATPase synthesis protein 25 mitochondrial [Aspergillus tanneri]|uniref:ATPase synthesis protein 25 n=1 Tax=Aspergillus tanneri TaxID=1220188 RepID=A0A5M9MTF1_9EURO|nr:ATPase synthesis protein 25 mitochondrial [Aspergillus tanneri]KAA8648163.1 ATPase synthesis protein 25 mitochondrial [Aspergillus tanneri]